jgi:hypothetical protein
MHPAGRYRLSMAPANDNRTTTSRALQALGERAIERVLGLAGALRFGLLLAGV